MGVATLTKPLRESVDALYTLLHQRDQLIVRTVFCK
jgi:hypothetical protein